MKKFICPECGGNHFDLLLSLAKANILENGNICIPKDMVFNKDDIALIQCSVKKCNFVLSSEDDEDAILELFSSKCEVCGCNSEELTDDICPNCLDKINEGKTFLEKVTILESLKAKKNHSKNIEEDLTDEDDQEENTNTAKKTSKNKKNSTSKSKLKKSDREKRDLDEERNIKPLRRKSKTTIDEDEDEDFDQEVLGDVGDEGRNVKSSRRKAKKTIDEDEDEDFDDFDEEMLDTDNI